MDKPTQRTHMLIGTFFVLLFIGLGFWLYRIAYPNTATNLEPQPTALPFNHGYPTGDVNHDSKVDSSDQQLVQITTGCKKIDTCWNRVVGKTIDGENPIYASDLDLNQDGLIDLNDYNLIIVK